MSGRDLPQAKIPKKQFLRLIRAASGVPVLWLTDDEEQPGFVEGDEWAWIEMGVSGIKDVGWDEQRAAANTATVPPTQTTIVIGRRWCTLNLMAYSLDPRELEAFDLCERVRMAFNRQVIHDIMKPNMALRWCEQCTPLPKSKMNGRLMLKASMDIQMSFAIGADPGNAGVQNYVLDAGVVTGTLEE